MGHRANLILVDASGYQLYYCHWCSKSLPNDLFWGPDIAQAFVKQQQFYPDHDGWLNTVWAEGGAVIDTHRRCLLFYGGESLLYEIPLRRLYLDLLRQAWAGWEVRWAYDGILDLAAYVGHPREDVLAHRDPPFEGDPELIPPRDDPWIPTVGSLRLEDGSVRLFPLANDNLDYLLPFGERLVTALRQAAYQADLALDMTGIDIPSGGFHIDLPARTLSYWAADDPGLRDHIAGYWPGWSIDWLEDRFEAHTALTQDHLKFVLPATETVLARLENLLLNTPHSGAINSFQRFLETSLQEGHDVKIDPATLGDHPLEPETAFRQQMFARAVAGWKASQ